MHTKCWCTFCISSGVKKPAFIWEYWSNYNIVWDVTDFSGNYYYDNTKRFSEDIMDQTYGLVYVKDEY